MPLAAPAAATRPTTRIFGSGHARSCPAPGARRLPAGPRVADTRTHPGSRSPRCFQALARLDLIDLRVDPRQELVARTEGSDVQRPEEVADVGVERVRSQRKTR